MRKKPDPAIVPLQSRMFAEGVRVGEVCARAGMSPATWSRWAAGGIPDLGKLRSMERALDEILASASLEELATPPPAVGAEETDQEAPTHA